jgi:peptide/nickel transport system substrate-binding protein
MVAFDAGELDIVEGIDPFVAQDLDPEKVVSAGIMPVNALLLNSTRPGLDDPSVRAAISQALDRESLASLLEGYAEPATGVLPINVPAWSQGSGGYVYDAAAASAVLEPLDLNLDLLYDSSSSVFSAVAEVVESQLAEVGVTVSLNGVDSATTFGRATSSDFDIVMLQAGAVSPTAFDPLGFLMVAFYPWTGADTTVITEQFVAGTSTTDPAAQAAAIGIAQDDARAQNTVIGMYNWSQVYAVSTDVEGFSPFPYLVWYPDGMSKSG